MAVSQTQFNSHTIQKTALRGVVTTKDLGITSEWREGRAGGVGTGRKLHSSRHDVKIVIITPLLTHTLIVVSGIVMVMFALKLHSCVAEIVAHLIVFPLYLEPVQVLFLPSDGLIKDPGTGSVYMHSDESLYEVLVSHEARDMWAVYLGLQVRKNRSRRET